jgi:glycosyltransferase involved in cell wall biosynthesis
MPIEMATSSPSSSEPSPAPSFAAPRLALPFAVCTLIPAYQAAKTLAAVVHDLRHEVPEAAAGPRVLVIDDGSTDGTGALAHELGCTVIAHGDNRGKGAALRSGLATARALGYVAALSVDADGQHPGGSARQVLYASRDPEALVLGVRDLVGAGAPRKNQVSNQISNFFLSLFAGQPLGDTQCGLRRYPIERTLALAGRAPGYAYESELLLRAVDARLALVETRVPVLYPPGELRVTHFDSVRDPARIIASVLSTLRDLSRARAERGPRGSTR